MISASGRVRCGAQNPNSVPNSRNVVKGEIHSSREVEVEQSQLSVSDEKHSETDDQQGGLEYTSVEKRQVEVEKRMLCTTNEQRIKERFRDWIKERIRELRAQNGGENTHS